MAWRLVPAARPSSGLSKARACPAVRDARRRAGAHRAAGVGADGKHHAGAAARQVGDVGRGGRRRPSDAWAPVRVPAQPIVGWPSDERHRTHHSTPTTAGPPPARAAHRARSAPARRVLRLGQHVADDGFGIRSGALTSAAATTPPRCCSTGFWRPCSSRRVAANAVVGRAPSPLAERARCAPGHARPAGGRAGSSRRRTRQRRGRPPRGVKAPARDEVNSSRAATVFASRGVALSHNCMRLLFTLNSTASHAGVGASSKAPRLLGGSGDAARRPWNW